MFSMSGGMAYVTAAGFQVPREEREGMLVWRPGEKGGERGGEALSTPKPSVIDGGYFFVSPLCVSWSCPQCPTFPPPPFKIETQDKQK